MINKLIFGHREVLNPLLCSLRNESRGEDNLQIQELDRQLEDKKEQRQVLVSLMTKGCLEPAVYNKRNNELLQEKECLGRQKEALLASLHSDTEQLKEVRQLLHFTSKATMLSAFDGALFTRFVKRIVVYSRTEIGFTLKCGITLQERL